MEDDGEDGFLDLDDDDLEAEEAEDVVAALGLGEDDEAPGVSTFGTAWGEAGLRAAEKVEPWAVRMSGAARCAQPFSPCCCWSS